MPSLAFNVREIVTQRRSPIRYPEQIQEEFQRALQRLSMFMKTSTWLTTASASLRTLKILISTLITMRCGKKCPNPCFSSFWWNGRLLSRRWSSLLRTKIDIQIKTALEKKKPLSTIQLDFCQNASTSNTSGVDGEDHRPVMIHRGLSQLWNASQLSWLRTTRGPSHMAGTTPGNLIPVSNENTWTTLGKWPRNLWPRCPGRRRWAQWKNAVQDPLHKTSKIPTTNCWRQRNGRRNSQRSSLRTKETQPSQLDNFVFAYPSWYRQQITRWEIRV